MIFNQFIDTGKYAYANSTYEDSKIVMVGVPYDFTSSNRAGSRFGPRAIRQESYTGIEEYSPYFDRNISDLPVHDLGDLDLPTGNKDISLNMVYDVVQNLLNENKIPLLLGGEHLISYPAIKAVSEKYRDLKVIQLDAHLDDIDELYGAKFSHGTVMRRVYELWNEPNRIFQVGVRSGSKEEFIWAREHTQLFPFGIEKFIDELEKLKSAPVYLTFDLDVFDPAQLPGTGTPEAGGVFFREFILFLQKIQENNINVVGCDIVELAPELDPTMNSAVFASKIVREILCIL